MACNQALSETAWQSSTMGKCCRNVSPRCSRNWGFHHWSHRQALASKRLVRQCEVGSRGILQRGRTDTCICICGPRQIVSSHSNFLLLPLSVKAAADAVKPAKRRHTESALSPELLEGVPSATGIGNEEVTGNEAVMGSEKVAADTPGSSAQCPPGWSLFDLVCRAHPAVAVTKLQEDTHMQPEAFKLLSALAKALGFPGGLKDTHRSAGLLVDPAAKPGSMAVTPGWTVPTWSAAVVLFEFKLHTTRSELDIMLGQVRNGVCMMA